MSNADSQHLLHYIRRLAGDPAGTPSDGEMLRRYLAAREESAFAVLVQRHGPMVYSVCQSVLRQRDDAEDAFQATFLILAQKAGSIRRLEGLGGWLQRVAYRVALKARTRKARRQIREAKALPSEPVSSACDDLSWREIKALLHRELAALPEQFRAPLVLCYLEGLTQEEAARQLGCTATTVKGRLQHGREKLRRRLERRGVALTAALGAALAGQALAEPSLQTVQQFTLETATKSAAALAQGFLRPLVSMKLIALSAVLLSLGVVAGGVVLHSALSEPRPLGSGESDRSGNRSLTVAAQKEAVDAHGDPLPEGAVARLGTVRFNHGVGLNALFFSPHGKTIISEGNGDVRLWDAENGKERGRIHTGKMQFPAYDQTMLLADGKTLVVLNETQHGEEPQGDVAHICDLSQMRETRTRKLPTKRRGGSLGYHDTLSPDGKRAVLHVQTPAQVQVFDLATEKNLYQLAKGEKEFLAVAFAGNDRIVSADQKQRLEVWEARTGKLIRQIDHEAPIRYLLASRDDRWLVSMEHAPWDVFSPPARQEAVHLWDMHSGVLKHSFRPNGLGQQFNNVRFSPDGQFLLTSSVGPWDGDEVVLWDIATGRRLRQFDKASGINAEVAAISADGSRLAAGSRSGKFALWDLKNGQRLAQDDGRYLQDAAVILSATGDRATLVVTKSISSWDAATGRRLEAFALAKDVSGQWIRARSADGRYAVTYSSGPPVGQPLPPPSPPSPQKQAPSFDLWINIWDLHESKCLQSLRVPNEGKQNNETSSAFNADSSLLATWTPGKQTLIRLWDVRSGKLVRSFTETKAGMPGKMRFTADGKTLFVAGKQIAAYEVASGKELLSWRMKPYPQSKFGPRIRSGSSSGEDDRTSWNTLAVSPEGDMIAAVPWPGNGPPGSKEDAIVLYDAQTGKLLRRCQDPKTDTYTRRELAFSSDGQLLVSTNGREIVYLWETATGKLIRSFKGHEGQINSLTFSTDSRRLASASVHSFVASVGVDNTVLIWDVTGQAASSAELTEAKLNECWNALAGEDAGRAHRAVWALARAARESVAFLKTHLHPVKPVSREQIERWIGDLDADAFEVREKATAELEEISELAAPALRRALENKPSLEQRRRIEPMLAKLEAAIPSGETLRSLRAVRVLEHAGTAEARQLLREVAGGAEGVALTRAAQAAWTRLNRPAP